MSMAHQQPVMLKIKVETDCSDRNQETSQSYMAGDHVSSTVLDQTTDRGMSSVNTEEKTDRQTLSSDSTEGLVVKMEGTEDSAIGISTDERQDPDWTKDGDGESATKGKTGQWESKRARAAGEIEPSENRVTTSIRIPRDDLQFKNHKASLSMQSSKVPVDSECKEIVQTPMSQWEPNSSDCEMPYAPSETHETTDELASSTNLAGRIEKVDTPESQDSEQAEKYTLPRAPLCVSSDLYSKSAVPGKSTHKRKLTRDIAADVSYAKPVSTSSLCATETPVDNTETVKCASAHEDIKTDVQQPSEQRPHSDDQCSISSPGCSDSITQQNTPAIKGPYACSQCEATFTHYGHLTKHIMKHAGQRLHTCDQCDSTFIHSSSLNRHMLKHTGHRSYACDQCEATFTYSSSLKRHRLQHTGEKFTCDECEGTFTSSSSLKSHMLQHTGEKPYTCDECEATFTMSDSLRKHMLLKHTAQKPFACDQCEATFPWAYLLKTHMLLHSGQRPYACDECEATFIRPSHLKSHQRIHTGQRPFTCEHCEASFPQSNGLKRHMLIHTGERPYTCDHCKATFTWASVLKSHMLTHTGQRPYTCDKCEATFTRSSSLKKHKRTHVGHTSD